MTDTFNYLNWWNNLEDIWRELLKSEIKIKMAVIRIKNTLKKELTNEEVILLKFKDNFEKNNQELKTEALKYITRNKKVTLGRIYSFELNDLSPLNIFPDLEEIQFINANIKNIETLNSLTNLKLLDLTRAKVEKEQIESFRKTHPECNVVNE